MRRDEYRPGWQPSERPDASPLGGFEEQLLGYGLAAAATTGGLVWMTGQAAGLLFGHTWLHVDPADVANIMVHLPKVWHDPQLAWPATAQRALPGPVGMYATLAGTTSATVAAVGQALRLVHSVSGSGGRPALGRGSRHAVRKSSSWARSGELRGLYVDKPEPGRVILGRAIGLRRRLLAAEDCHSVMVFGPPGSYKTVGLVAPAILEWYGPLVSTSVKPDVLEATLRDRRRKGEVFIYDPLGATGLPTSQWTPLATCGTWSGALTTAYFMAQATDLGTTQSADHQYWTRAGVKFLAPMLHAAAVTDRTMADVLRWVNLREGFAEDREDEIAKILADLGTAGEAATEAWAASMFATERRADSLYATAEDLLQVYQDDRVAASTEGYDIDPEGLLSGDNTLYLYAPPHEQRRLRPLFETLTSQVVRSAQERAARSPRGILDPRLLLALDEAGNVAALADLPELATTGRGQGIQILSVWHDEAQLRRRYGEAAATVVNGHRAKVFLSGLADIGALEQGSKLIGDEAVVELNPSVDTYGRRSHSQSTTWRPLVAPDELRRLQPREGIVIYGHHKPVKVRLRPWFERREQARLQRGQWRALKARERAARRAVRAAAKSEARARARAARLLGQDQDARRVRDGR